LQSAFFDPKYLVKGNKSDLITMERRKKAWEIYLHQLAQQF